MGACDHARCHMVVGGSLHSLLVLEDLGHVLCFGTLLRWKAVADSSITLFGSIALFLWN